MLTVQRSFLFLRTSMPVGVSVTGAILAVVPSIAWFTSRIMLAGIVTIVIGRK